MRSLVRWSCLVALALCPAASVAQLTSGFVLQRGDPEHRLGVQLGTGLDIDLSSRVAVRLEGAYGLFGKTPDQVFQPPCANPGCPPVRVSGQRLIFANTTVNLRLMEARDRGALYWIGGIGLYMLSNDSAAGNAVRFGWNVGGGVQLGRTLSVDLRYHEVARSRRTRSLIPISLGIRF